MSTFAIKAAFAALLLLSLSAGCSHSSDSGATTNTVACATMSGTAWTPNIASASTSNHGNGQIVSNQAISATGLLTGISQSYGSSHEITISGITMDTDLGVKGSLSLVAKVTEVPSALGSDAEIYPALVSLVDSAGNELVNVTGCTTNGFDSCSGGVCTPRSGCGPASPSAYIGYGSSASAINQTRRLNWDQSQRIFDYGNLSINRFPTCSWADPGNGDSACDLNSTAFAGGKLKYGAQTYTAKYVLLSNFLDLGSSYSAKLTVNAVRKQDSTSSGSGALDMNVILVGSKNIAASRTDKGKQNLDALFTHVYNHYSQTSPGIKLGKVTAYEWDCANGGDSYATTSYTDVGKLFETGSAILPSSTEGKAVNIFLVSTIPYSGAGTILGIAGGIGGSPLNGTAASGAAFSSFNKLDSYNPSCNGSGTCAASSQEEDFLQMGSTISHEMGHFLGLNHPSESDASEHDKVPDTPKCTTIDSSTITSSSSGRITIKSCLADCVSSGGSCPSYFGAGGTINFCPTETKCQFNHVMWWTSKNVDATTGSMDGNLFSADSSVIIHYSPLIQ